MIGKTNSVQNRARILQIHQNSRPSRGRYAGLICERTPVKQNRNTNTNKSYHLQATLALWAFDVASVEPPCRPPAAALPMVILLIFPSAERSVRSRSLWGLPTPSRRTLPPRCMRLACPGVKARRWSRPALPTEESRVIDGGEQVMGGERRRSALPRR